jgi:hypothetical protein
VAAAPVVVAAPTAGPVCAAPSHTHLFHRTTHSQLCPVPNLFLFTSASLAIFLSPRLSTHLSFLLSLPRSSSIQPQSQRLLRVMYSYRCSGRAQPFSHYHPLLSHLPL